VDDGALAALRRSLAGELLTSDSARTAASRDASFVVGVPVAVVRPVGPDDVVALVRWARTHRTPLTARGGGTSLDGESVPLHGGLVVDFSGWTDIGEVDPVGRTVRVGPGVVNRDLALRLAPHGLFFPPNPGSWRTSTIGGNLATNASGPRSFRYGPTRRWVRSADVVLGTGERVVLGTTLPKRAVGPELLDLVVGSEGTLGLVTSVTLGLAAIPARRCAVVVPVPGTAPLGPLVAALAGRPSLRLSAIEYVDERVAAILRGRPGARLPGEGPLVLLEVESDGVESETQGLDDLARLLRDGGVVVDPSVVPDADQLWTLRGEAGAVLDAGTGPRVREDIAVPVARLDEALQAFRTIADRAGRELYVYGHLGQGNLHPNVAVDPATEEGARVRSEILALARRLGGTVSGEHGVGSVKRGYVSEELGDVGVRLLQGWKPLCDPDGILNPGKLLPEPAPRAPSPGP
jgi:D-lactate dehydrogenase